MKTILGIIGIMLIVSCNEKENKNIDSKTINPISPDVIADTIDSLVYDIEEPVPSTVDSSFWIISTGRIGEIKTGGNVPKAIKTIKANFNVKYDSIGSVTGEEMNYFYNIYINDSLIFIIHTDSSGNTITTIEILSDKFISQNGFRVGDSYGILREKFDLLYSDFENEWGLYVFATDFHGTFHIENGYLYDQDLDSIPDKALIDQIVIY